MYCEYDLYFGSMYHLQKVWMDEKESVEEIRARKIVRGWENMNNPEEDDIMDVRAHGVIDVEREEAFLKNYGYKPGEHEGRIVRVK